MAISSREANWGKCAINSVPKRVFVRDIKKGSGGRECGQSYLYVQMRP